MRILGYIVMLRARMFRSLIPVLMIKERNIRARNITIKPYFVFILVLVIRNGGYCGQVAKK